jgi:hypothetical protein
MSDLALPFVLLFEEDALAFACFERLMRKASAGAAMCEGSITRARAMGGAPGSQQMGGRIESRQKLN